MCRILCSLFFGSLFLVTTSDGTIPLAPFYRAGNSYESIFGTYIGNMPAPGGYTEIIEQGLKKIHDAKASFQDLNQFGFGLDQLFTFKILQKYYEEELSKYVENSHSYTDHVNVPDYVNNSGLVFKDLIVYGFPMFKKGVKVEPTHDAMNSELAYQITARYTSDATILTGSLCTADSKYFFVYHLKSPFLWLNLRKKRNSEEFVYVKRAIGFDKEDLVHTYDSTYENATEIIPLIKETLTNKLLPHVFFELSQHNLAELNHQITKKELLFVQQHYKVILNALLLSANEYIKGKIEANGGNDIFFAGPLTFDLTSPAPKPLQQKIDDIKLKGFLNYVGKPEFVYENASLSDDGRLYNMTQGVKFTYAQEGDKQATVGFVINLGRKNYTKEYKVQYITFVTKYFGDLTKKPFQVYRNKDTFISKTGLLVAVDTYDGDPVYEYVLRHLGVDIVSFIQKLIESSA